MRLFKRLWWRGALIAAAVVSLAGGRARAGEASRVEALIHDGVQLRQDGHDARALPLFQQAFELERGPRTVGQLGLCELALGYWLDAEAHLGEALASASHPWIEKNRATLEGAREKARENLGEVALAGGPAGGAVVVDRKEVGRLPLKAPLRLNKGPHDLEVRVGPGDPWRQAVMVEGRDKQTFAVVVPVAAAAAPVAPAPEATVAKQEEPSGSARRPLAWASAAVAAAGLGVGVYETVEWIRAKHDFEHNTGPIPGTGVMGLNCGSDLAPTYGGDGCKGLHDRLAKARLISIVSYGATTLFAAGSAYLFATSSAPLTKTDTALSCAPDLLASGLSCSVTF